MMSLPETSHFPDHCSNINLLTPVSGLHDSDRRSMPSYNKMSEEMLSELMSIVGMANQTNALANGFQIEVHEAFHRGRQP
jgi:hypothetical protein